jgi:hypothetical protein
MICLHNMGSNYFMKIFIFNNPKPLNYQTVSRRLRDRLRCRPFSLIGQSFTRSPLIGPLRFRPEPILGEEEYFVTHKKERERGKSAESFCKHTPLTDQRGSCSVLHFAQLGTHLNVKGTVSERNFENVKGTVSRDSYTVLCFEI